MPNTIEPPILMSRLMTLVFSAAVVVVIVLVLTIVKMYPLDRTQIFFLTTVPRSDLEIQLSPFTPDAQNMEIYKQNFVKEYIKARNEIIPNASVMQRKWSAGTDGVVAMWSTPDVYANFTKTDMWTAYMNDQPELYLGADFGCPVEFNSIQLRAANTYSVKFKYFCTNSDGQTTRKDYTIIIKLEIPATGDRLKWNDRLENPLGIRVSEYNVETGDGDPLDFKL